MDRTSAKTSAARRSASVRGAVGAPCRSPLEISGAGRAPRSTLPLAGAGRAGAGDGAPGRPGEGRLGRGGYPPGGVCLGGAPPKYTPHPPLGQGSAAIAAMKLLAGLTAV
ncbi:hypothetical protein ACFXKT_50125, partial [Streptomyces mirabilis]